MEMEIISREKIKPSSPTPHHLRIYNISLLDQIITPAYVPAVLYFSPDSASNNADESISEKLQLLRDSLALTLTLFYPFAGVIRDAFSVDCNDQGLPFSIVKVEGQLRDFLEHPNMQLISRFLPTVFTWNEGVGPGANIGMVQVNCFDCGGLAICVTLAHQLSDATTICTFLRAWAAIARRSNEVISPDFIASSAFPQMVTMPKESYLFYPFQHFLTFGRSVTKRYVFDASSISRLKAKSTSSNDHEQPTRVEVISAFLWKCFSLVAAEKPSSDHKPFLVTQPVNLRRRADPSFPDCCFGNFLWLAATQCMNPMEKELIELVNEMKKSTSKINKEFMKSLQSDEGYYENVEEFQKGIPEEAKWFALSSWSRIGLYDVDFGWGNPVWLSGFVSSDSDSMVPNSATLIDTRSGDGIEAWVILEEKYVAEFEKNEELKMHACFNPSVL